MVNILFFACKRYLFYNARISSFRQIHSGFSYSRVSYPRISELSFACKYILNFWHHHLIPHSEAFLRSFCAIVIVLHFLGVHDASIFYLCHLKGCLTTGMIIALCCFWRHRLIWAHLQAQFYSSNSRSERQPYRGCRCDLHWGKFKVCKLLYLPCVLSSSPCNIIKSTFRYNSVFCGDAWCGVFFQEPFCRHNTFLKTLCLDRNRIGVAGAVAFGEGLRFVNVDAVLTFFNACASTPEYGWQRLAFIRYHSVACG